MTRGVVVPVSALLLASVLLVPVVLSVLVLVVVSVLPVGVVIVGVPLVLMVLFLALAVVLVMLGPLFVSMKKLLIKTVIGSFDKEHSKSAVHGVFGRAFAPFFWRNPMQSFKLKWAAFCMMLLGMFSSAHAALPSAVANAITTVGSDLETAAGMVITAMVAFWGLRKLGAKMGWW